VTVWQPTRKLHWSYNLLSVQIPCHVRYDG